MSTTNTPHSIHSPHAESRDPIMEDDHFSLRYGNPIKVIHDIKKHKLDDFEPTKEHVSGALASTIGDALTSEQKQQKPPLTKNNSSFLRDSTICSEFYHDKKGSVTEVEHKDN
ncbi:hypothetical protein [Parasitella parasitica]|uniref:Uncharacterized protein n=1 Tax=Parasitella parasitica TaxID=35722 RepID=A0A0B7MSY6_9FUNG|nr:hypothetical protein [Parasitella parasitica]